MANRIEQARAAVDACIREAYLHAVAAGELPEFEVTDFGIARITDSSKTKTGMVLGTPSYMSPEQLSGKKIDGRSDLFSLGVMLFQLVCGQLPFTGESMAQLMFKIANEPHPDPRTINAQIPEALARVIDRALCKEIEQRYQDGEDMARELRGCLGSAPEALGSVRFGLYNGMLPDQVRSGDAAAHPEAFDVVGAGGVVGVVHARDGVAELALQPELGVEVDLPRAGRFSPEQARALGVPVKQWKTLQHGESITLDGGRVIRPEAVLGPARQGLSFVFSGDTAPCPALEKAAAGADLLLCDSTYALPEQAAQAKQYGHSTFGQSAALAAKAGAKRLWLVHYSPMITDPEEELAQAQSLFPAAECGYDGKSITLQYEEAEE